MRSNPACMETLNNFFKKTQVKYLCKQKKNISTRHPKYKISKIFKQFNTQKKCITVKYIIQYSNRRSYINSLMLRIHTFVKNKFNCI